MRKVLIERLTGREISKKSPAFERTREFRHRVHKNQSLVPILSQITEVHPLPCYLLKVHSNIIFPPRIRLSRWLFFLQISSPKHGMYFSFGYLVLFQSKHSCFWCSLISVSIGQHVSTLPFLGHHQISPFFVCGSLSTFCNATYSRCLFYIWLKYIHMAKILVIILQYSYMVRYLFYLWLGFWYNTIETLW